MFVKCKYLLQSHILKRVEAKMSIFVQKMNPITGSNDWVVQSEEYDYHQEVARAAFADMLHDTERNQLYEKALKAAIDKKHSQGEKANVLDIGTGTGLLSMMAVRNGADSVIACEAFKPMSECAKKIIVSNGYADKIKIIPKRSTDIIVGEDMKELCNILVTEVFDTELIGEGALSTFQHAHNHLLEKQCIVVPSSATIFAHVVECPLAHTWNKIKDVYDNDGKLLIKAPESIDNCAGSAAVHDLQLSQLPANSFNTIISPKLVFKFDWSGKTPLVFENSCVFTEKAENDGIAQVVFMWWELEMDTESKIILSCAPVWAHPWTKLKQKCDIPWRDHWMQAVYYLPEEVKVEKGEEIHLICCHDEYSLWFSLISSTKFDSSKIPKKHFSQPECVCGLHVSVPRTRIGQMNDAKRIKKYLAFIEENLDNDSCVLVMGNASYFGLSAAQLGVKKMYFFESNHLLRSVLSDFILTNNIKNVVVIPSLKELKETNLKDVNFIISEPYFSTSILPWDNLLFLYLLRDVKQLVSDDVQIFPQKVVIYGIAVHFKDLYKIRSPLETCEGFKMDTFDRLIQTSSNISDDNVEAQPLWEYPGYALSPVQELASISIVDPPENVETYKGTFDLEGNLNCNGIALWTDWYFTDSPRHIITTGPVSPVKIGEKIDWYKHVRQGVCMFPSTNSEQIKYSLNINLVNGSIGFKCT
ncbi:protein arginine N-methyltransferase 7 [Diorhabda sublineata]|uniref:protein arginine N-methyltransferase 7 n=1 Tax=Diorhabda sublineata TaxID=1163346 RepID=UPI0024E0FEFD|nr:protein arginine N-methyltransferase 7 [Diorhabda sublineata]